MTEEEIKEMFLKDFKAHENEIMTKNAWIVAEELVKRIDGAAVLGEYIHCQLSEEPSKMFVFLIETVYKITRMPAQKRRNQYLVFDTSTK